MAERTTQNDPRRETSITINASYNFAEGLLSERDIIFIQEAVSPGDVGTMAALNSGLPMRVYTMKSLMTIRVRHRFSKVRVILEPIIAFAVSVSHFQNTRRILRDAMAKRAQLFNPADINRIEAGLYRIYRAVNSHENPYTLIEAIQNTDLPRGAYESHVKQIYALLENIHFDFQTTARLDYTRLSTFNYFFVSPKFTSQEAIDMYADNLANITRRSQTPLQCLTVTRVSRDPHDVLNDCLFALALGNAIVSHQDSVRSLHRSLIMDATALCSRLYPTYLQVPETRRIYAALARECFRLTAAISTEPVQYTSLLSLMFQFVREIIAADVYACPDYVTQQIFAISGRFYGLQSPMFGHAGDLDVEIDPTSVYQASYHVNNPFTDPNIFKCPKDIVSHIGSHIFEKRLTTEVFTDCTDRDLSTEAISTDMVKDLVSEGAARALKITPHQVQSYLNVANTPSEVLTSADSTADLFADVYIEPEGPPADEDRRINRTSRFINLRGARPYPANRR